MYSLKSIFLIALAASCYTHGFSQAKSKQGGYNYVVSKATGDLNNDRIPDLAVVTQDTSADKSPYRLQIFFGKSDGTKTLVLTSDKAIKAEFEHGKDGFRSGESFYEVKIVKNVLSLTSELLRGNSTHKFRYQNGQFELIGFTEIASDGNGHMYNIDFNLSTGQRVIQIDNYETGAVGKPERKIIKIRPLPNLGNFTPYSNSNY